MLVRQVRSIGAEDAVGEEVGVAVHLAVQNTKIKITKLDGVGSFDYRPSTKESHQKKICFCLGFFKMALTPGPLPRLPLFFGVL